jgi:hypothetical protein
MQITKTLACNDPFKSCPNVLFKWPDNIKAGVQTLQGTANNSLSYPGKLAGSADYQLFIFGINVARKAAGLNPIPNFPAPPFTTAGQIGAKPPNQRLEDAVRGYNGFAGNMFGLQLHEFVPDRDYLLSVPNEALANLNMDARVWRRVLPGERPQNGDPNYVSHVSARSPQCGG